MWTRPIAVAVALAVAPPPSLQDQEFPSVVRIGDEVRGTLPAEPDGSLRPVVFELWLADDRVVVLEAGSLDFDVALAVLAGPDGDAGGSVEGEMSDRDSGPALDARLVLSGPGRFSVRVRAEGPDGGDFLVRVHPAGPATEPAGAAADVEAFGLWFEREHSDADMSKACRVLLDGTVDELRLARLHEEAERALELFERVARGHVEPAAWNRGQILMAYFAKLRGDWTTVRARLEPQLDCLDEQRPRMDLFVLDNLAELAHAEGRFAAAARLQRDAAARARAHGERGIAAMSLSRVGRAEEQLGNIAAARAAFEEALDELEHAPAHPVYPARTTLNAARFFVDRGELDRGRALLEEVLSWDTLRPPHEIERLSSLSTICRIEGRHAEMVRHTDRIQVLLPRASDEQARDALLTLAACALRLGDVDGGLRMIDDYLARTAEDEVAGRIEGLATRCALLEVRGDLEGALVEAERALELSEAAGDLRRVAETRMARARMYTLVGRPDASRADFERLLVEAAELQDVLLASTAEAGLAKAHLRGGDLDSATSGIRSSVDALRRHGAREYLLYNLEIQARVALAGGDALLARSVLDEADAIFEGSAITSLEALRSAGVRSRFAGWASVAQDAATLAAASAPDGAARARAIERGLHDAAAWKGRALLEGLAERASPSTHDASPAELVATLRAALGERWILVEYAAGDERLFAYVLDERGLERHDLGDRRVLEADVAAFVDGISGVGPMFGASEVAQAGSALHERLVAPLLAHDVQRDRGLVLVPTAELAQLPFDALVTDVRGAGRRFDEVTFLLEERTVVYAPSSPVLATLAARAPRGTGRVLFVGDPVFPAEARADAPTRLGGLRRLSGTRTEVLELANVLQGLAGAAASPIRGDQRGGSWRSARFDLHLGGAATLERFRSDLSGYRMLHCATHGLVDAADPSLTGLVLSRTTTGGADEWVLGLAEVRALELDADLVVLSACETARGRVLRGEGIQSLAHAFLEAGSRGVVASLWMVDDDVTRELMQGLYRDMLAGGASAPAALRGARLALLRATGRPGAGPTRGVRLARTGESVPFDTSHPYLWAPFLYVGRLP